MGNLSFDQAPAFSVPLRFFITACLFGVVTGGALVLLGPQVFLSRWMPGLLALTHLVGTGILLQVMVGACFQFVPVVTGANIAHPRLVANLVHPLLVVATLALVAAFIWQIPRLFLIAALAFVLALGGFVATMLLALARTPANSALSAAFKWPLLALGVTVALGTLLAGAMAEGQPLSHAITNVHLAWALGAWSMALLGSVATVVVPMFQITPPYPRWFERGYAPALFLVVAIGSSRTLDWSIAPTIAQVLGLALLALFAILTLVLQAKRRRKLSDTTFAYFRLSAIFMLAVTLIGWGLVGDWWGGARTELLLGLWMLLGVLLSAVSGMLYKIVPFLCWLHIQRRGPFAVAAPNMKEMIPERLARGQFVAHLLALALLTAALWMPSLTRTAGLAFALSSAWLGWNLVGALRVYRRAIDRMPASVAHSGP